MRSDTGAHTCATSPTCNAHETPPRHLRCRVAPHTRALSATRTRPPDPPRAPLSSLGALPQHAQCRCARAASAHAHTRRTHTRRRPSPSPHSLEHDRTRARLRVALRPRAHGHALVYQFRQMGVTRSRGDTVARRSLRSQTELGAPGQMSSRFPLQLNMISYL